MDCKVGGITFHLRRFFLVLIHSETIYPLVIPDGNGGKNLYDLLMIRP